MRCLLICEIHCDSIHGKDEHSCKDINGHFMVIETFTLEQFYNTNLIYAYTYELQEFFGDNDDDVNNINVIISYSKTFYSCINIIYHPIIRNYANIITKPDYIKLEIADYIILPTQEAIAILKTFWLRIIQRTWKKVFKQRQNIIKMRQDINNIRHKEIRGQWPSNCLQLPSLNGMLKR